jgi:hypothetical protein
MLVSKALLEAHFNLVAALISNMEVDFDDLIISSQVKDAKSFLFDMERQLEDVILRLNEITNRKMWVGIFKLHKKVKILRNTFWNHEVYLQYLKVSNLRKMDLHLEGIDMEGLKIEKQVREALKKHNLLLEDDLDKLKTEKADFLWRFEQESKLNISILKIIVFA